MLDCANNYGMRKSEYRASGEASPRRHRRFSSLRRPRDTEVHRTGLPRHDRLHRSRQLGFQPGGGSAFGYSLIWVVTLGTVMLMVLQHNAAHLGIATGYCLSEAATIFLPRQASVPILGSAVAAASRPPCRGPGDGDRREHDNGSSRQDRRSPGLRLHPIHALLEFLSQAREMDNRIRILDRSFLRLRARPGKSGLGRRARKAPSSPRCLASPSSSS